MEEVFSKQLFTSELEDIISVGFCDETENGYEYSMNMDILYLSFEHFLVKMEAVENYSRLSLSCEKKIKHDYIIDEDMKYAFSKLHNVIFKQGEMVDVFIEKMVFFNLSSQNMNVVICDALKVYLSSGQVLFFDPAYYFGINIGDETSVSIWEEQNKSYNVKIIDQGNILAFR